MELVGCCAYVDDFVVIGPPIQHYIDIFAREGKLKARVVNVRDVYTNEFNRYGLMGAKIAAQGLGRAYDGRSKNGAQQWV